MRDEFFRSGGRKVSDEERAGALISGIDRNFLQHHMSGGPAGNALVKSSDGTVSAAYDYDAFGNTLKAAGEYARRNPLRFSTKYADAETGLLYYGYRYYDPQTGRWISRDPQGESGGLNLYAFVGNNPATRIDALGLRAIEFAFVAFINGRRGDWLPEPGSGLTGYEFNTNNREFGQFDPVRRNGKVFGYGSIDSSKIGEADVGRGISAAIDTGDSRRRGTTYGAVYTSTPPFFTLKEMPFEEVRRTVPKGSIRAFSDKTNCVTQIRIRAAASYPFIPVSPDIDFVVTFTFKKEGGKIKVALSGVHNHFPDYEAYVDGELMYTYYSPYGGPGLYNLGIRSHTIGAPERVID